MTDLFFVHCPESGFDCFLTLDAALDEANERIQGYLGDAWSEEVTGVCVGKITHRAKMCDQVFPDGEIDEDGIDEAGEYWDSDIDCKCNYKMLPAEQNPAPDAAKLVEALNVVKAVLESDDPAIADTVWVPGAPETLLDHVCAALAAYRTQDDEIPMHSCVMQLDKLGDAQANWRQISDKAN